MNRTKGDQAIENAKKAESNGELLLAQTKQELNPQILPHEKILNTIVNLIGEVDFDNIVSGDSEEKKLAKQYQKRIIVVIELLKAVKRCHFGLCQKDTYIYVFNGAYWSQIDEANIQRLSW